MYGYAGGAVAALSSTVTQVILPNATIASGGWLDQMDAATDLHSPLADDNPLTWVQSPPGPVNAILKLGLNVSGPPGPGDILIEIDAEIV